MSTDLWRNQLEEAFKDTHFGPEGETDDGRAGLVERGVLEILAGYRTGSTLHGILLQLGLITDKGHVTTKGKKLAKYGYDANVSMDQAKRIIDAIAANGWKKPEQKG